MQREATDIVQQWPYKKKINATTVLLLLDIAKLTTSSNSSSQCLPWEGSEIAQRKYFCFEYESMYVYWQRKSD